MRLGGVCRCLVAVSVGKNKEGKGSRPGKQVGNRIRKAGGRKIGDDTEQLRE